MNKLPASIAKLLFWPTLLYNVLLSKIFPDRRWFDRVDETVFLGALPLRSVRHQFEDLGVRRVINMCREWPGPVAEYSSGGIAQLWLSTVDYRSPTVEQILDGIKFIEAAHNAGESVYLHCKAGRGRSATIAVAWVMRSQGVSAGDAQVIIEEARPHVGAEIYKRDSIREFAALGRT